MKQFHKALRRKIILEYLDYRKERKNISTLDSDVTYYEVIVMKFNEKYKHFRK